MNHAYFPVVGVRRVLLAPMQGHRANAYRMEHPIEIAASLDVRLPAGLKPHRASGKINSPGFASVYQIQASSTQGRIDIKYRSLKHTLKPAELDGHAKAVQQLANLAGVNITVSEVFVQRGRTILPRDGRR